MFFEKSQFTTREVWKSSSILKRTWTGPREGNLKYREKTGDSPGPCLEPEVCSSDFLEQKQECILQSGCIMLVFSVPQELRFPEQQKSMESVHLSQLLWGLSKVA